MPEPLEAHAALNIDLNQVHNLQVNVDSDHPALAHGVPLGVTISHTITTIIGLMLACAAFLIDHRDAVLMASKALPGDHTNALKMILGICGPLLILGSHIHFQNGHIDALGTLRDLLDSLVKAGAAARGPDGNPANRPGGFEAAVAGDAAKELEAASHRGMALWAALAVIATMLVLCAGCAYPTRSHIEEDIAFFNEYGPRIARDVTANMYAPNGATMTSNAIQANYDALDARVDNLNAQAQTLGTRARALPANRRMR